MNATRVFALGKVLWSLGLLRHAVVSSLGTQWRYLGSNFSTTPCGCGKDRVWPEVTLSTWPTIKNTDF